MVAKDGPDTSAESIVKLYVTNVNEAPTAPAAQSVTFAENSGTTGTLMTVTGATDPDGTTPTYALSGAADANPGSRFVVAADGKITLAAGKSLDFEGADLLTDGTGKYYAVKVVATDGALTSAESIVKIYVTNVNEAPTAPAAQSVTFVENSGTTGTLMTVAGATDPDGTTPTYALSGAADANPGSRFVVAADGKITLAAGKSLDFEGADLLTDGTGKYYAIKVVATDGTNTSADTIVKVYVTNDPADDASCHRRLLRLNR